MVLRFHHLENKNSFQWNIYYNMQGLIYKITFLTTDRFSRSTGMVALYVFSFTITTFFCSSFSYLPFQHNLLSCHRFWLLPCFLTTKHFKLKHDDTWRNFWRFSSLFYLMCLGTTKDEYHMGSNFIKSWSIWFLGLKVNNKSTN